MESQVGPYHTSLLGFGSVTKHQQLLVGHLRKLQLLPVMPPSLWFSPGSSYMEWTMSSGPGLELSRWKQVALILNCRLAELIFSIGIDWSDPVSYSLCTSAEVKVLNIIRCSQHLMPLQVRCVPFPPVLSPAGYLQLLSLRPALWLLSGPSHRGSEGRESEMRFSPQPPPLQLLPARSPWRAVFFRLKVSSFSRWPNLCNALSFWISETILACTFRPRGGNHDH